MASKNRADAVEKLEVDGTNFSARKFHLKLALRMNDLWGIVSGTQLRPNVEADRPAWDKKDEEAQCIISTTLSRSQIHRL